MPSTVYLVTGGARSGKSNYALNFCESICKEPIYLATSNSNTWDDDFKDRVKKHKEERGDHWTLIEEPLTPSKYSEKFSGRVVLVDCLTLLLTNYMVKEGAFTSKGETTSENESNDLSFQRALESLKVEFNKMIEQWDATFVFVTNEIGSSVHSSSPLSRKFVDAQGWLNQHIAKNSSKVIHCVCGVPNVIKDDFIDSSNKSTQNRNNMLDMFLNKRALSLDPNGYFKIKINTQKNILLVELYSCIKNSQGQICDLDGNVIRCCSQNKQLPFHVFEGRTAKEVTVEIFERFPDINKYIKSLGHATYIGREVQKAEYCLQQQIPYKQN